MASSSLRRLETTLWCVLGSLLCMLCFSARSFADDPVMYCPSGVTCPPGYNPIGGDFGCCASGNFGGCYVGSGYACCTYTCHAYIYGGSTCVQSTWIGGLWHRKCNKGNNCTTYSDPNCPY